MDVVKASGIVVRFVNRAMLQHAVLKRVELGIRKILLRNFILMKRSAMDMKKTGDWLFRNSIKS